METKTTFKYFDIVEYEKEAVYLSKMHASGWKFTGVTFPGFYHFEACEPAEYVYQLDYNQEGRKNEAEYHQMFADCGWEYLTDFVDYSYFRKPASEMTESEEGIFCDDDSRLEMMKRIFKGRLIPLVIIFCLIIIPNLLRAFIAPSISYDTSVGIVFCVLFVLYLAIFAKFAYGYYKVKEQLSK